MLKLRPRKYAPDNNQQAQISQFCVNVSTINSKDALESFPTIQKKKDGKYTQLFQNQFQAKEEQDCSNLRWSMFPQSFTAYDSEIEDTQSYESYDLWNRSTAFDLN